MIDRIISAFFVVVFAFAFVMVALEVQGQRRCLQAGYPTMKWGALARYCVKRVNQTDSVVALSSLPKQK